MQSNNEGISRNHSKYAEQKSTRAGRLSNGILQEIWGETLGTIIGHVEGILYKGNTPSILETCDNNFNPETKQTTKRMLLFQTY